MAKLSPQARRWRTILVTVPIMVATSVVLYQRLVEGKPQRTIAKEAETIQRADGASKTRKQEDNEK
ncbi:hypothetical protein BDN71DRAFT_1444662 [Pleurotus eryngii]|uniref:Uncharacterized protein n=1 Tax=Pleurotus eryngii TaxID=5323 RepID=A0A9P6A1E2_PLEER|nr:hypothetical protein BDN71DRAFT_1444662 [Pleurotus eryngii]